MPDDEIFSTLRRSRRVWAVASIHGEAERLDAMHKELFARLEPGDRIVLVATASAHREAAIEACRFLIDWLKTQAPFWKLEETPDGGQWVDARSSDDRVAERWLADKRKGKPDAAE